MTRHCRVDAMRRSPRDVAVVFRCSGGPVRASHGGQHGRWTSHAVHYRGKAIGRKWCLLAFVNFILFFLGYGRHLALLTFALFAKQASCDVNLRSGQSQVTPLHLACSNLNVCVNMRIDDRAGVVAVCHCRILGTLGSEEERLAVGLPTPAFLSRSGCICLRRVFAVVVGSTLALTPPLLRAFNWIVLPLSDARRAGADRGGCLPRGRRRRGGDAASGRTAYAPVGSFLPRTP